MSPSTGSVCATSCAVRHTSGKAPSCRPLSRATRRIQAVCAAYAPDVLPGVREAARAALHTFIDAAVVHFMPADDYAAIAARQRPPTTHAGPLATMGDSVSFQSAIGTEHMPRLTDQTRLHKNRLETESDLSLSHFPENIQDRKAELDRLPFQKPLPAFMRSSPIASGMIRTPPP
jgi:hypothetical protein